MPQYALIIAGLNAEQSDRTDRRFLDRFAIWVRSTRDAGMYRDNVKLRDGAGYHVELRAGQVTDGPFVETKETISGILTLEASDVREVIAIARECPLVTEGVGRVEIRELTDCPR